MAGAILLVLAALVLGGGYMWGSANARLGRYLGVSDTSSEGAIERDLLQRVTPGTSIQKVMDYLEHQGLRQEGGSTRYYLSNANGTRLETIVGATAIACVFDYTSGPIIFGEEHYHVWFLFDDSQRLESVRVRRGVSDL